MWEKLKQTTKPIALYGMGDGADKVLNQCRRHGIPVAAVFASDGFARHNDYQGFTVDSYSETKQRLGDMTVLVCFGTHRPEVMDLIRQVAREQELYIPDVPVAGDVIFDRAFAAAHRQELEQVWDILADETSRQVFRDVIEYKLTGEARFLDRCATTQAESYRLLGLGSEEHYVDLGAYRGDTLADFLALTDGHYASITAVEPEKGSYKKLLQAAQGLENCRCVQAVMTDRPGEVPFRSGRGRGSGAGSGALLAAESLDHLMDGRPVTYLNIDVEGNEAAVLTGGANTIAAHRPKTLLAAYHRSEDLFDLPLRMLALRPDYRVYLRHWPCYPAWDVNYIFT